MKRLFDIVFAVTVILLCALPALFIALAVHFTSPGPVIYWSDRVGRNNRLFRMPKFRTMVVDAPVVATHLMSDPGSYTTSVGKILRKTSLDELPQLWSILRGDMSVVGPRPALFNQDDLIEMRSNAGVDRLRPGLTGWAQINGRDELPIPAKVGLDIEYMHRRSFYFDCKIILITLINVLRRQDVSH